MTYMQALRLAMDEEMARDEKVILWGQDVGYSRRSLQSHRRSLSQVRRIESSTRLWQRTLVGFGIGAAMTGWRPIMEIMKMDFSMCSLDP